MGLKARLFVILQYVLPQHGLSWLVNKVTRMTFPPLKNALIRLAIKGFGVDMSQAAEPDPKSYASFNHFFTRPLKDDVRPLGDESSLLCPADGAISQLGPIRDGTLVQAKGHTFTVSEFITPAAGDAAAFANGSFLTVYLSPRDYHRVHMPWTGTLSRSVYVPGKLFSVSPTTTAAIPRLFARNERLITRFECDFGPMIVALVGAVCVSSMSTVWEGVVTPGRRLRPADHQGPMLKAGEEMGRFNMGSTVIVLLPPDSVSWRAELAPGASVQMGQALAAARKPTTDAPAQQTHG